MGYLEFSVLKVKGRGESEDHDRHGDKAPRPRSGRPKCHGRIWRRPPRTGSTGEVLLRPYAPPWNKRIKSSNSLVSKLSKLNLIISHSLSERRERIDVQCAPVCLDSNLRRAQTEADPERQVSARQQGVVGSDGDRFLRPLNALVALEDRSSAYILQFKVLWYSWTKFLFHLTIFFKTHFFNSLRHQHCKSAK